MIYISYRIVTCALPYVRQSRLLHTENTGKQTSALPKVFIAYILIRWPGVPAGHFSRKVGISITCVREPVRLVSAPISLRNKTIPLMLQIVL
jgi:hypothetical protein